MTSTPCSDRSPASITLFAALADLVEAQYVLADRAGDYAARIRRHADELAAHLPDVDAANEALHALVPDRHLSLRRRDARAASAPAVADALAAGGICRVEHLPGGIGLLELHPVFAGPDALRPHLRAAALLLRDARGLILDLRRCFGGDTDSAALIHGWLLGAAPVHLGHFEHRGRPNVDYVSDPGLGWNVEGPVRILTSATTFSGGEDLAYVQQALGRASVVGEPTAGGAHPVEHFPLSGGRVVQIPVARSVIAATGSNWEGVGVMPDTVCAADEALSVAVRELGALCRS